MILLSQVIIIREQQQKLALIEMYTISECNICDIFWNSTPQILILENVHVDAFWNWKVAFFSGEKQEKNWK